jgi:competence protein ComEC
MAIALMVGIVVGDAAGAIVPIEAWLFLLVLSVVACFLLSLRHPYGESVGLLASFVVLGGALYSLQQCERKVQLPTRPVAYDAVCISEPQQRGKVVRMDLLLLGIDGQRLSEPWKVKASLLRDTIDHREQRLHLGNGLQAFSVLELPADYRPGGHFSYQRWMEVHGYRAQTFIYSTHWYSARESLSTLSYLQRMRLRMLVFRQRLLDRYRALGLSGDQFSILAAMTLGDKSYLSKEVKDEFSVSGVSHLLALSGLHLSIIYAFLTLLVGFRRRGQWISQMLILSAIWMYVALVGFPPSVVRSAVMLSAYSLCLLLNRAKASLNVLALTAIVMLVANPLVLWDVGFQLSYLSVVSILLVAPRMQHIFRFKSRLGNTLWGMVSVSVAAQMGTAAVVLYYFGRFSCYFLLANLLCIPIAYAILSGTILMFLTMPFLALQKVIAFVLVKLVGLLNALLSFLSALPGASVENIDFSLPQVWLTYLALALLWLAWLEMKRLVLLWKFDYYSNRHPLQDKLWRMAFRWKVWRQERNRKSVAHDGEWCDLDNDDPYDP